MAKKKAAAADTNEPEPAVAEYTVLARRYRPQQFADLIGQEPVAQSLINAIKSNRVAHAYLFTGVRGVGKTSAARIFAKALNCEKGPTAKPCEECDLCKAITSGEDVDVLEIDGASNNGVDQVRQLRENVQYRPQRSRYKIYIIDEVHMLSTAAFNALLKTLEEPPSHVKFIFATTDIQKIPVTILSRCQRFDFAGIGTQQIIERLRGIVASEKMEADDDALKFVARRAGGSMRDAQSLLDQLLSFGSERLTIDRVHLLLGTAHEDRVLSLASAIFERDPRKALDLVGAVVDKGQQLGELFDQLIDYWRDLMIVNCGGDASSLSVSGTVAETVKQQAQTLQIDTILAGLDIFASAKHRLPKTTFTRIVLEMAVVRLCRLEQLVALSQLAQWAAEDGGSAPATPQPVRPAPAATPMPSDPNEKKS